MSPNLADQSLFLREALDCTPVVRCRLGPMTVYLVAGGNTVSSIFRSSFVSDPWILRILTHTAGYASSEIAKFSADHSGVATIPRKDSTTTIPPESRIWHAMHRTHEEGLVSIVSVASFAVTFQKCFRQELLALPTGQWTEVRISDFLKKHIAIAATRAILGSRILQVNPGFIDAFWDYEQYAESLSFGLPSFLNRRAINARERFRLMCRTWFEISDRKFDWEQFDGAKDQDWEPVFGSQISRGLARWGKQHAFSADSFGAAYALLLFG